MFVVFLLCTIFCCIGLKIKAAEEHVTTERVWTSIFQPANIVSNPTLSFDFKLDGKIEAWMPEGTDVQHTFQFRGPDINQQIFLVYKGIRCWGEGIYTDNLEFRGVNVTYKSIENPEAGVWYHAVITFNWAAGTASAAVERSDEFGIFQPWWVTGAAFLLE